MPSSMTHTYFGLDVYKNLSKTYQNKITNSLEYFKLFCQGSDPFMFYNFLIGKKAKQISNIQKTMHCHKTKDFFINTIQYIHNNKLQNNSDIMSFLYGYICHYYLDLYTHPLIYYKSGIFNRYDKNTYKYNGLHQKIEYEIDLYFINKNETIKPNKFKIHKQIYNINKLSPDLKKLIKFAIEKTYSITNADNIYEKSIRHMTNFFKIANYDPHGIKLKLYTLIDKITPPNIINIKELSFSNKTPNINNYLNLNHNNWYYPWTKQKINKTSFLDLYQKALNHSINTIQEVTNLLNNNKLNIKKLNTIFPNLSFKTGLNCNKDVTFKYYEF